MRLDAEAGEVSSPGELLSAECHVDGTASTAYKNVFEENTKSLAPGGAEVQASAVSIWSSAILPPFLAPWTYLPKSRPHEDAMNVMLSDDRKTLYWNVGYASLWGETLERKEGMSPYSWMDVISETVKVIVAVRAYPGGLFIPQVSSLIIDKETGRATYSFNDGDMAGILMAGTARIINPFFGFFLGFLPASAAIFERGLSSSAFRSFTRIFLNFVILQLHALAYNLGNFLRTLATPSRSRSARRSSALVAPDGQHAPVAACRGMGAGAERLTVLDSLQHQLNLTRT